MRAASARLIAALPLLLLPACAQTLTYDAIGSNGAPVLTNELRERRLPFVGNRDVDREVKRLPSAYFGKAQAGSAERISCWRLTTTANEKLSAVDWTLHAVLRDHILLHDPHKPASRVIDAEDLLWIEAPREFDVGVREHTVRARRIEREEGAWRVTDYFGKIHRPGPGEISYTPPKAGPPDEVYGFDQEGDAWPLDFVLIRGFIEGTDKSAIVLGTYRTVPKRATARWEFDKEWGPWSYFLAPYLAGRWIFTNKDYVARCEQFP